MNCHLQNSLLKIAWAIPLFFPCHSAQSFENFHVAVYARVYEVKQMADPDWLKTQFDAISPYVQFDKIYLETHRDNNVVDQQTLDRAKNFFHEHGIATSGGITITMNERNRFETFCYTNSEHRKKLKEIVEFTAGNFDEIILDDFFFTNCKCETCIKAKGKRSWTDFRLALLTQAAKELILAPARETNPSVHVIIKYPNWYEHFQGLGFNLQTEPPIFDGLYTGTETRDPSSNQHLQPYLGYLIFRFFENLKPGGNRGGWVDTGGSRYLDRYAEQLWLTLFAKAPEMTLFDFGQIHRAIRPEDRAQWQGQGTSFDFDSMIRPYQNQDGTWPKNIPWALAAGYTFEQADKFLGELGRPIGIKSYKPLHSLGEDFLQTYLGMIGIPMDLVSDFPSNEKMIILTESAKFDRDLVAKIQGQLRAGNNVMITSGLLRALQDRGLDDIVELRYSDKKALVKDFKVGWGPYKNAKSEMLIPQIHYLTNDSWEEISAMDETNGWPMLHSAAYGKGTLYVLTIPENFIDLYNLPAEVLTRIRETLSDDRFVVLDGPAQISLFVYDNNTFIVESFLPESADLKIIANEHIQKLQDVLSGETMTAQVREPFFGQPKRKMIFPITVRPHSYRVFRCQ